MTDEAPDGRGGGRRFATTRWSLVLAAGATRTTASDAALAELCADYWYPLYGFVRQRGHDPDAARDLTQAFFAHLLERRRLQTADPARGRFRSFLLAALKNFLTSEWRRERAEKRGGGVEIVALDRDEAERRYQVEPAHALTPEAVFERRWAMALLDRALHDVRRDYAARGETALFDALRAYLGAAPGHVPYAELSTRLARSEPALRTALSRLRARWRTRLRQLVAETVGDATQVDDELGILLSALGTRRTPDGG